MRFRILKGFLITLLSIIIFLVVVVGGYISYISIQYYRIDDQNDLTEEIKNNQASVLNIGEEYIITTYNIGFGAYTHDFSFFMDSGMMKDKTKVSGTGSTAASKEVVLRNTNGSISIADSINADFMMFQEVDVKARRSYKVNQFEMLKNSFNQYGSVFAYNFHSSFLFYPIFDPHGSTDSGIATFSKYQMISSMRYQLPVDNSFPNKFFDLDRCFMISRISVVGDKELVLINVHLSAYDKGGIFRAKQLEVLNNVLKDESEKGNYVIVGGDFNHDIANSLNSFPTEQEIPEWVYILEESQLPLGYSFATSNEHPTCRSTDMPYTEGVNYTVVLDGFIISNNIQKILVTNVVSINEKNVNFLYSDHNLVKLSFILV